MNMKKQKTAAGIDVGSRTIKLVVYDGKQIVHEKIVDNSYNTSELIKQLLDEVRYDALVAAGYGRALVEIGWNSPSVSEITAFAIGCSQEFPGEKTVLDIGGQDTKVIRVNDQGKVLKFEMNDRCAAGTGKFFEVMAKTLNLTLDDFADLFEPKKKTLKINSLCTVFAESEVISLLAKGESRENIVYALHKSVINKIIPLIKKVHTTGDIVFCGGCAKNHLLHALFEEEMNQTILIPRSPQLVGAYGASVIAMNSLLKKQSQDMK
ncbi:MAG: acyl-CoA dehydratase activase [Euryarchaeota archaeon]|nr:acyl-CoA dehydratase activase [Euryarchaeota archaeon]